MSKFDQLQPHEQQAMNTVMDDLREGLGTLWTTDNEQWSSLIEQGKVRVELVGQFECYLVRIQRFDREPTFSAMPPYLVENELQQHPTIDPLRACIRLVDGYFESDYDELLPDGDQYNHISLAHQPGNTENVALSPLVFKITSPMPVRTHSRTREEQYIQFAGVYLNNSEVKGVVTVIMAKFETLYDRG